VFVHPDGNRRQSDRTGSTYARTGSASAASLAGVNGFGVENRFDFAGGSGRNWL
jgi:hypothetical protein